MAQMIRPVSDLRNNFADISKTVHKRYTLKEARKRTKEAINGNV